MLIQGLPAEIRHAEHCVENTPQDLHPQAVCLWTFSQNSHTQAVESRMTQSSPLTSLLEPTSGGYVALIVTQQVAHRGKYSVFVPSAFPHHFRAFCPFQGHQPALVF